MVRTSKDNELRDAKDRKTIEQPLNSENESSDDDDWDDEEEEEDYNASSRASKTRVVMKKMKKRKGGRGGGGGARRVDNMVHNMKHSMVDSGDVSELCEMKGEAASEPASVEDNNNEQEPQDHKHNEGVGGDGGGVGGVAFTELPGELDRQFLALDEDGALRSTTIKPADGWTKRHAKSLMSHMESAPLGAEQQREERNKAFDLLDALSRSGVLDVDVASLHVVLAATHCFDKTLLDSVIQDNINPIEKVEKSELIVASTIQACPPLDLIQPDQCERVQTHSFPALL